MPDSLSCTPDYQYPGFQIPLSKSFPDSGIRITLNGGGEIWCAAQDQSMKYIEYINAGHLTGR